MLNLRYQFNSAMTSLPEFGEVKRDCVPVLLKDGDFRRVPWLGYIDLEDAKERQGKAVKLDVHAYSVAPGPMPKWQAIPDGMAIQGCCTSNGVYCVVDNGAPKIVPRYSYRRITPIPALRF